MLEGNVGSGRMPLPPQYVGGLAQAEARHQKALIAESKREYEKTGKVEDRPHVTDKDTKRSKHAVKFQEEHGYPITDLAKVRKDYPDVDVKGILAKGRAAYMSSGSRPNVTANQWAYARLASVLEGGKALRIDKDLVGKKSLEKITS